MALEMKRSCEKCNSVVTADGAVFICSYECTYCAECAAAMHNICPNCGGELVKRPRRRAN